MSLLDHAERHGDWAPWLKRMGAIETSQKSNLWNMREMHENGPSDHFQIGELCGGTRMNMALWITFLYTQTVRL